MSLDGYVIGPDVSLEEPMGRGGEALQDWRLKGRSAAQSAGRHTPGNAATTGSPPHRKESL